MADLIRAAAPWATMGLVLATLAARSTVSKKKGKKSEDNYGTEGMGFGTALATALGNNAAIGMPLGRLGGLAIGMCIKRKEDTGK